MSFIPHNECTVLSGDCFYEGNCLSNCQGKVTIHLKEWDELSDESKDVFVRLVRKAIEHAKQEEQLN